MKQVALFEKYVLKQAYTVDPWLSSACFEFKMTLLLEYFGYKYTVDSLKIQQS